MTEHDCNLYIILIAFMVHIYIYDNAHIKAINQSTNRIMSV